MTIIRAIVLAVLLSSTQLVNSASNIEPTKGLVPDAETAVAIAIAVFMPIFGDEKIQRQRPFKAELKGDVWHVFGSLPPGWVGGTAEAEISRKDGRVIKVWHGQ